MTSQFGFPFDETTDIGRRTIFQTFLRNFNQGQQAGFGIPSFQPVDPGFNAPFEPPPGFNVGGRSNKPPPEFGPNPGPSNRFQLQQGGGFLQGQQKFLSGLFNPTFNKFLGQIGSELQQDQTGGNTSFGDFLGSNFNPQREIARSTQRQQGIGTSNLIGGRTRFLSF